MGTGLRTRNGIFRLFTIALLLLSIWTAYANVFSDDTSVRADARRAVRSFAGCGEDCRIVDGRGDRGMFGEHLEYEIEGKNGGHFEVTCRRAFIAFGEHTCVASRP